MSYENASLTDCLVWYISTSLRRWRVQVFHEKKMENIKKNIYIILCPLLSIINPPNSWLCVTICSNSHVLITSLIGLIQADSNMTWKTRPSLFLSLPIQACSRLMMLDCGFLYEGLALDCLWHAKGCDFDGRSRVPLSTPFTGSTVADVSLETESTSIK